MWCKKTDGERVLMVKGSEAPYNRSVHHSLRGKLLDTIQQRPLFE